MEGPITALQTLACDWSLNKFIEVNFSKLTDSNQTLSIDFVCIHYHLSKISSRFILLSSKFSPPMVSLKWTLYNYNYNYTHLVEFRLITNTALVADSEKKFV